MADGATARLRPDRDFHVLTERGEQPHQALAGEVREASIEDRRDFGLAYAHEFCRRNLGQILALDRLAEVARKLRLGQLLLRFRQTHIGEYVAAARRHRNFSFPPLDH